MDKKIIIIKNIYKPVDTRGTETQQSEMEDSRRHGSWRRS
jgi:hypothetical protein